jgi:hypothetical protein
MSDGKSWLQAMFEEGGPAHRKLLEFKKSLDRGNSPELMFDFEHVMAAIRIVEEAITATQGAVEDWSRRRVMEAAAHPGTNFTAGKFALQALLANYCTFEAFRREHVDDEGLRVAIAGCHAFERVEARGLLDAQVARHSTLKQYLPLFLRLPFEGGEGTEPLISAIARARALHEGDVSSLGPDTPVAFARGVWRKAIDMTATENGPDARVWELALAFEIDAALRRGDLHLPRSREHVPFWNLVHNPQRWADQRERSYVEMKLAPEPENAVARLRREFDEAADAFVGGLAENRFAGIEAGGVKVHRRDALEVSNAVRELRSAVETHIPEIGIEELLVAVDRRCRFVRELTPLGAYTPRVPNLYAALLATLLAHGTNLGLSQMALAARIPLETLEYVSRWFFRDETLRAVNRVLVDYHHSLPLSSVWGYGGFSSCDGQLWGVQQGSLHAALYPRYFGYYERAINVLTHISDQHSIFATRAISCGPREALYVLDGLLENDTVLKPREHTTDTHGITEQLFGLCDLLGISFMPRFRDIADVQLYRLDRTRSHGPLDAVMRSVETPLILEQWDALVRIAASLRDRSSPAHVVLDRLGVAIAGGQKTTLRGFPTRSGFSGSWPQQCKSLRLDPCHDLCGAESTH